MRWPWTKATTIWPTYESVWDYGSEVRAAIDWAMQLGPEKVWNSQPYVRTVVTFLARNVAQLGVHVFTRVSDTERERQTETPLAYTLAHPNSFTTTYELVFGLIADKALYDRAYLFIADDGSGTKTLTRIPPTRVVSHRAADPLGAIDSFRVQGTNGSTFKDVPAKSILYFPGWNPMSATGLPSSPLDAIRDVIAEQTAAFAFRKLAWVNGLQSSQVIERPSGATWKDGARDRFMTDVREQFGGNAPRRNGVLLLEDGMKLSGEQFNAREAEWIDAAKLSLALVASIYHVNPTMVGLLDNANYSNVREFRKMLYGDTLGPIIASVEARLNAFLVPLFDETGESYVEFNIAEKLQGNFEEQASAMQTAVGAPWMLRSEARALLNLPPIDGADELIVPLNVLAGPTSGRSTPAPAPSAAPEAASAPRRQLASVTSIKSAATEQQQRKVADVLADFFARQSRVVLSRLGSSDDWWDGDRWDRELSRDLKAVASTLTSILGKDEAERLGFSGDEYDVDQTLGFIDEVAQRYAGNINDTTKQQLDDAIADDDGDPAAVFETASGSRSDGIALGYATFAAGFAMREAGRQIAQTHDVAPTKTWIVGANPRPSHARMDGETVGIDEAFSNGMQWPAESGDVDEVAGCNCSIEISI